MDALGWLVAAGVVVVAGVAMAWAMPALLRDTRRRQRAGAGGSLAGIAGGLDAVWRPSTEDAHADWAASVELPAPAPLAGDKGLEAGRVTIHVRAD